MFLNPNKYVSLHYTFNVHSMPCRPEACKACLQHYENVNISYLIFIHANLPINLDICVTTKTA